MNMLISAFIIRLGVLAVGGVVLLFVLAEHLLCQRKKKANGVRESMLDSIPAHEKEALDTLDKSILAKSEFGPLIDLIKVGQKRSLEKRREPTICSSSLNRVSAQLDNEDEVRPLKKSNKTKKAKADVVAIQIMAPSQKPFRGNLLLQTLLKNDFHYGPLQIFHRYADNLRKDHVLFSIASVTEPGEFDLKALDGVLSQGLILFMEISDQSISKANGFSTGCQGVASRRSIYQIHEDDEQRRQPSRKFIREGYHPHPRAVFKEMVEVGRKIATRLGGMLKYNYTTDLTQSVVEQIEGRLPM
jgi:hypothetical protein